MGNPLTDDAREGRRRNVCARILPSTYAQLKQAKARLGLRSIAGAWEYILRLGLAVVDRGRARSIERLGGSVNRSKAPKRIHDHRRRARSPLGVALLVRGTVFLQTAARSVQ